MNVLPTTVVSSNPPAQLPRWADLKRIGDAQRLVLLTFLFGILAIPVSAAIGGAFGALGEAGAGIHAAEIAVIGIALLVLGVRVWMCVAVYRLARALASRVGVLWAIGAFLPNFIGLVVLVVISARATGRLKKSGLKVGLLGAKLPDAPPPGFVCQEVVGAFS